MKINNFQIGLFTIVGIFLFVAALFLLGIYKEFMPKGRFVSLFRESVQGLNIGSPVKFKGVPIGSVSAIAIRIKDRLIRVDMEIDLNAFSREKKLSRRQSVTEFYSFFDKETKAGLRCRLQYAGITGLKYLELDYYKNPEKAPLLNVRPRPQPGKQQAYIPSLPSIFSDILSLINTSLEKISKLPLEAITAEMKQTIIAAKELINSKELKHGLASFERTSNNLEKTSTTINNTFTEKRLRELLDEINKSLNSVENLAKTTEKQVKGAKMIETTESFRGAANSVSEARQALTNTLLKLDQTLDSLTELVNYLNDDPSALIRGKNRGRVIKESRKDKKFAE
jgi:phospholipid/cholesterol/gamma-HCH transport system substrate-binding protein